MSTQVSTVQLKDALILPAMSPLNQSLFSKKSLKTTGCARKSINNGVQAFVQMPFIWDDSPENREINRDVSQRLFHLLAIKGGVQIKVRKAVIDRRHIANPHSTPARGLANDDVLKVLGGVGQLTCGDANIANS